MPPPVSIFADNSITYISELSSRLMRLPELRAYPDISALAFWCRRANLERMKANYPDRNMRLGRGLCFHIAPGNIPVNFAFTYMFGLLAGCANVVRLPSKDFGQVQVILRAVRETLRGFPEMEYRSAFVRYPADNEITAEFCRYADARVIWGGDQTIARVRMLPVRPRCVDLCFADRYSVCILSGKAILQADDARLKRLGEDFYNDTYLMDQNACSSPQMILWTDDSPEARKAFWDCVYTTAEKKYNLQAAVCMEKYLRACEDAVKIPVKNITRRTNLLYNAELEELGRDVESFRGRGGYFYEYSLKNWEEFCGIVSRKFQTVTYFGIDPARIRDIVISEKLAGIDRIVPIGRAMDIGIIWDGFDVIRSLSRIVEAV